jgi:predicted DNA-binding transcriptional regulator AlpA
MMRLPRRIGFSERTRSELDGVRARIEPRGLSRVEAATYVGVSPSLFDEMVKDRRMPKPKRINSRTVWDRKRLDEAFEALPDDGDSDGNPWDQVVA